MELLSFNENAKNPYHPTPLSFLRKKPYDTYGRIYIICCAFVYKQCKYGSNKHLKYLNIFCYDEKNVPTTNVQGTHNHDFIVNDDKFKDFKWRLLPR